MDPRLKVIYTLLLLRKRTEPDFKEPAIRDRREIVTKKSSNYFS